MWTKPLHRLGGSTDYLEPVEGGRCLLIRLASTNT